MVPDCIAPTPLSSHKSSLLSLFMAQEVLSADDLDSNKEWQYYNSNKSFPPPSTPPILTRDNLCDR